MDIPFGDAANVWIATAVTPLMNGWKNSRLRCKKRTAFANRLSETRSVRVLSKLVGSVPSALKILKVACPKSKATFTPISKATFTQTTSEKLS